MDGVTPRWNLFQQGWHLLFIWVKLDLEFEFIVVEVGLTSDTAKNIEYIDAPH